MSLLTYIVISFEEGAKRRVGQCLRMSDDIIQDFNLYETPSQWGLFFQCQIGSHTLVSQALDLIIGCAHGGWHPGVLSL
jgi:hypothetical protein